MKQGMHARFTARQIWSAFACVLVTVCFSQPTWAQVELERFERRLEQIQRETRLQVGHDVPLGQQLLVDYGGYFSPSYLSLDDVSGHNHGLRQYDLVGYGRLNLGGAHEFFARGRFTAQDFNTGDSFDGRGDRLFPVVERLFYRFDLQRYLAMSEGRLISGDLSIQGGRDLVYWANGLVLARVLDGVVADAKYEGFGLKLVAGVTPHDSVDFDSSRPDFFKHTHRGFFGGMFSTTIGTHHPYAYLMAQEDFNHNETLEAGTTTTRFDYNSVYLGFGSSGNLGDRLVYGSEFVLEGGRGLSNSFVRNGGNLVHPIAQTHETIEAFAGDVRIDYLPTDVHRSRLGMEFIFASGDRDRENSTNTYQGNASGSADHGFNAFGAVNTGLAFFPNVSNLLVLRFSASTFPLPDNSLFQHLQTGVDFSIFQKLTRNAPIDEPTFNRRFLGVEPDLFVNWQISSDVTFAFRYGLFLPSARTLVHSEDRTFVYAGLTFAF